MSLLFGFEKNTYCPCEANVLQLSDLPSQTIIEDD
jgi:hypothetical protein